MKRASVSGLRHNFAAIERVLRRGETIEITKRKRVVAKLMPPEPEAKLTLVTPKAKAQMPDFMPRLKSIYGNRILKVSGAELIARDRDRY